MKNVRKSFLVFNLLTGLTLFAHAQQSISGEDAQVERIKALVEAGAVPKSALDRVQAVIADRADEAILQRTLYGTVQFDQITDADMNDMVAAAERRKQRIETRIAELKPLIEQGIFARKELEPLEQDLADRERTVKLAVDRVAFVQSLAEMAKAEQAVQLAIPEPQAPKPVWQRFDGRTNLKPPHIKAMTSTFEQKFGYSMPVSAYGSTAYHKAMGFDHTGRLDVQINPDTAEGQWLLKFLESLDIPYFAFRSALAGSASGAHIHVGPPSVRRTAIAD